MGSAGVPGRVWVMVALAGVAGCSGAGKARPATAPPALLTGTVVYRERIALPPSATLTVRLTDVSKQDVAGMVLAEQVISPVRVPAAFALGYDPAQIDSSHTYVIQARIQVGTTLRFINMEQFQVLTWGAPQDSVEVLVRAIITDSAFARVQERGAHVMGVDQDKAQHVFETLPDGGRIALEWPDTTGAAASEIATIREHMHQVARDFGRGDFSAPFLVHDREVPGTAVMRDRRAAITYSVTELPGGAMLRITSSDPAALSAIAEFLAFQRSDHRAAGHDHGAHQAGS